jgi:hypothetical protein
VTEVTPTGGPAGTVVTLHGTGLQPAGSRVVVQSNTGGGSPWFQHVVKAEALSGNSTGTELSFEMPQQPEGVGEVGLILFTPSGQAKVVPVYQYFPSTAPRARVAGDDVASLPSHGSSSPLLFAVALGAVVVGWGLFVVAVRRSSTRAS